MGLTELIFKVTPTKIGTVELDAAVTENHEAKSKVTRHPIEAEAGSPSSVSDHVVTDPLSVTIDGVISGHPAETAAYIVNLFSGGGSDPVLDAHQTLLDDLLTGRLVTIETGLLEYPNMVLESVSVTRDAAKGNSLHFRAVATQVTLVQLKTVDIPTQAPTKTKKNGGKKPKKEVTNPGKASFLANAASSIGSALGF